MDTLSSPQPIIPQTGPLNMPLKTYTRRHKSVPVSSSQLSQPRLRRKRFASMKLFNPINETLTQPRKRKAKKKPKTLSQPIPVTTILPTNDIVISDSLSNIKRCNDRLLSQTTTSKSESNAVNNTINVGNLVGFNMVGMEQEVNHCLNHGDCNVNQ